MRGPFSILLCFLAGCGTAAPPAVEDSLYYPLQVGNRWVYQGPDHQRVLEVVKHTVLEGKAAAILQTRVQDKVVAVEHIHASEQGIFILALGKKILTKPLPFLRLPPKDGRTWKVHFSESEETQVYHIGRDQVIVPYGTFETVTLRTDILSDGERKLSNLYWFAEKVGIVKHAIQVGQKITIYELVDFVQDRGEKHITPER